MKTNRKQLKWLTIADCFKLTYVQAEQAHSANSWRAVELKKIIIIILHIALFELTGLAPGLSIASSGHDRLGDDFGIDVDYAEYLVLIIDLGDDVFLQVVYAEDCQLWKTTGMTARNIIWSGWILVTTT